MNGTLQRKFRVMLTGLMMTGGTLFAGAGGCQDVLGLIDLELSDVLGGYEVPGEEPWGDEQGYDPGEWFGSLESIEGQEFM